MEQELLQKLAHVTVDSTTALEIAKMYMLYKYIDEALSGVLVVSIFIGIGYLVRAVAKYEHK